jgi:hypothetical protein
MLGMHLARDKARLERSMDESGRKKKVTSSFLDQNGEMHLLLHGYSGEEYSGG